MRSSDRPGYWEYIDEQGESLKIIPSPVQVVTPEKASLTVF